MTTTNHSETSEDPTPGGTLVPPACFSITCIVGSRKLGQREGSVLFPKTRNASKYLQVSHRVQRRAGVRVQSLSVLEPALEPGLGQRESHDSSCFSVVSPSR
jgi:hypothetical protein